jgi:argininosuccinate lyase
MADGGYLGAGGRLAGGPADELVEAAYTHELRAAPRLAYDLSLADIAHAVALTDGGALPAPTSRALLSGLLELHAIPPAEFPWQAELGDAFNSREAELVRRIGGDAAGWLSAGRPRREAFRVALRSCARRGTAAVVAALADGAGALSLQARELRDALAADYTYLQAAQPTTAGHLLLAYAYPALRDAERLQRSHRELSRSVAGAGGSAGSRWPLDRALLADLLGCDGIVQHTKDAAWQWDVYVELLAALAIAATHLSQLAQDFEIYASHEFGLIELADRHSRASALMPQKRNPYALAAIRTQAGQAAGDVSAVLTVTHTGSARTDHFHLLNGLVPRALEEAGAVARLAAAVLAGLRVNGERMARAAREGFTNAADVADVLAQTAGLDYRTAHKVVGLAVRRLVDQGAGELTAAAIAEAALEVTGASVEIDPAQLDPAACAQARLQAGSSSPEAMEAMLAEVDAAGASAQAWASEVLSAAAASEQRLLAHASALATAAG